MEKLPSISISPFIENRISPTPRRTSFHGIMPDIETHSNSNHSNNDNNNNNNNNNDNNNNNNDNNTSNINSRSSSSSRSSRSSYSNNNNNNSSSGTDYIMTGRFLFFFKKKAYIYLYTLVLFSFLNKSLNIFFRSIIYSLTERSSTLPTRRLPSIQSSSMMALGKQSHLLNPLPSEEDDDSINTDDGN